ncbi:MAG: NINE protein [Proteobacteria bacterium]|nr:NINE protein [Pseudomonadota bacterium]
MGILFKEEEYSLEFKKSLSERQLFLLNSEMEKHKKSTALAYVLLVFFGFIGIHQFYIGKIFAGLTHLLICCGIVMGALWTHSDEGEVGWVIIVLVLLLLVIWDLFTLPRQIRMVFEERERKALKRIMEDWGTQVGFEG